MKKIKIGISSCLLGKNVRYDGGHKLDHYLTRTMGQYVEWVPVCPEVEYGLPVPREAMHLVGNPDSPHLVTRKTGIDHTRGMLRWTKVKLKELESEDICGFIFKSKSPSSGMRGVKIYTGSGLRTGAGIFAKAFMEHFPYMPVEDDSTLEAPRIRENFIARIFVYLRWKGLTKNRLSATKLSTFHSEHKLLLMAHSAGHLRELEALVLNAGKYSPKELFAVYLQTLTQGLRLHATVRKNVHVLQYIKGYLKKQLRANEITELSEVINQYQQGLTPLIVPITLLKHYAWKYNDHYLKRQYYLNPHPVELMLRNHV